MQFSTIRFRDSLLIGWFKTRQSLLIRLSVFNSAEERQNSPAASLILLAAIGSFLPPPDFTKGLFMATAFVSPRPSRGLTLRQIIQIVAKGYEGSVRSWDHFINDNGRMRKDADTGDTLVTFIIREFGDIHDEAASTDDQLVVARAAVAGAIGDLERVLAALDDADESQASGFNNDLDVPPAGVTEPS